MIHRCRCAALAGLSGILLALPGCLHHDPVAPFTPSPTLRTIWPNDDGRSWTYQAVSRAFTGGGGITTYPSAAAVPPAPSMTEVAALLDHPPAGTVSHSDTASFGLRFGGLLHTLSGVIAQNLAETLISPGASGAARTPIGGQAAFLVQLYRARPDLRPLLRARFSSVGLLDDTTHTYVSIFLHGYAWEKTTQWIGTYGDIDTLLAWKFLTSRLSRGSEFTHQLVPSLASDVFLHGRILDRQTVHTPAGTFANAVVCAYLVDYGISVMVDATGDPIGYFRDFNYGSVAYVDGIGPVACYERRLWGMGDVNLRLTGYGTGFMAASRR